MKLLTTKDHLNKTWQSICLENIKDAEYFIQINSLIKAKQAISFWTGFKTSKFYKDPLSYNQHQKENNPVSQILALRLTTSEKEVSIVDYCNKSDDLIERMNKNIFEIIELEKKFVKINSNGGYCPINNFSDCESVIDINEEEMYCFLLHKKIDFKFEINKSIIVIENGDYIPQNFIDSVCEKENINKKDIQIFSSFKHRTILFKDIEYYSFFEKGLLNKLKNIIFETTGTDECQIENLIKIFEHLMTVYPEKKLNFYIKTYNKKIFQTKLSNINIKFIYNEKI